MWPRFCYLLLLSTLTQAANDDVMAFMSNLPLVSVPLPDFSFRMTINHTDIATDRPTFRSHLEKVTENHLKEYLQPNPNIDDTFATVQGVELTTGVDRVSNPTTLLILEAVFLGGKVTLWGVNDSPSLESKVEEWTHEALKSDYYWHLLHKFVEDPVLASVQNLDVTFYSDSIQDDDDRSNDDSIAMAAILAVCITILVLSMALLIFMGYRQYYIGSKVNCCSSSAKSDTTYEEDEEADDDDEVDGTFVSSMVPPRVKRPSKRQRAAHAHASLSCCSTNKLEVITEEDDFTNVPLGTVREDMETPEQTGHNTIMI